MEFLFILIVIPAAIIYLRNSEDEATRWLTFFMFCSASGSFSRILRKYVIPDLDPQSLSALVIQLIRFSFYFLSHHVFHYGLLMYAIVYSLGSSFRFKKHLFFILLIPLIYSIAAILQTHSVDYSKQLETISYFYWTTIYDFISAVLIVFAAATEKNFLIRKSRIHNAFILVPTIIAIIIFINIRNTFLPSSLLNRTILGFVVYSFIAFIVIAVRNGVMGVKIQIKDHVLNSTTRATANGTDIINHTIKDEMHKIRLIIDRTRIQSHQKEKGEILNEFSKLYSATDKVLEFVDRIRDQTQDVEVRKEEVSAPIIIDQAIEDVSPHLAAEGITVTKQITYSGNLQCDPIYIREVLKNVLKNSIEALHGMEGHIAIEVYHCKRKTHIAIKDNGSGIPSSIIKKVKEPFFSTKNDKYNYGLGLNFSANVMKKHGGRLEVFSDDKGATVILIFPSR